MAAAESRPSRRADVLIVAGILAVALAALLVVYGGHWFSQEAAANEATLYAVVQNPEGEYDVLPLDEDTTLTVTCSTGTNTVTVKDGAVCISDSDCKNQICVNGGWKNQSGDTIVCLPHRLVVQVVDESIDRIN